VIDAWGGWTASRLVVFLGGLLSTSETYPGQSDVIGSEGVRLPRLTGKWVVFATVIAIALAGAAAVMVLRGPDVPRPSALPASFVAEDGATYRSIGTATMDTWRQRSVSVMVRPAVRTAVVGVLFSCAIDRRAVGRARSALSLAVIDLPGDDPAFDPFFTCPSDTPRMLDVDVRKLPTTGDAITLTITRMDSLADTSTETPASWSFRFYEMRPPRSHGSAPPTPMLPPTLPVASRSFTLWRTVNGVWPDQRTAQLNLPAGHRLWAIVAVCSSVLSGLGPVTADLGATPAPEPTGQARSGQLCAGAGSDAAISNRATLLKFSEDQMATEQPLTVTLAFNPMFDTRVGSWSIGFYHD
jgi:hypothetical protein